jgi:hypothetical protein
MRGWGSRKAYSPGKREQGTAGQNVEQGHFSMYYFYSADHISGEEEGGKREQRTAEQNVEPVHFSM